MGIEFAESLRQAEGIRLVTKHTYTRNSNCPRKIRKFTIPTTVVNKLKWMSGIAFSRNVGNFEIQVLLHYGDFKSDNVTCHQVMLPATPSPLFITPVKSV